MEKRYELDMCSGSVFKKMLVFALPLMCSSVLQLLFNAADIVVVGRFAGDNSLAAVGSNTSLINLLTNVFIGLSIGANVLAARHYGADEVKELSKTVHTSMLLSVFSGFLLTVVGLLFAKQLLVLMKTPPEVLELAAVYLRIYFAGMPAMMIYNFGSALLRAVGDTKRPLYYLLFSGVINVILNLIFVIALKMDVAGVALATVISQCISAFLVVRCLMNEQGGMQLIFSELKFDVKKFLAIIRIGLPAGFQGVVFSFSNVVIQSSINLFGETVVAGNSAASNIEGFIYVAMNAFHQATISFTSQNIGAGKIERVNKIMLTGVACVFVTGAALGGIVLLFGRQLLGIYSESAAVIDAGMVRLSVVLTTYFLCGMMDVMVGSIRGMGYSVMPMIVSLIGACGLRLVWIATIFQIEQFHVIDTIYYSYPVTWTITFIAHLICFAIVRKKLESKIMLNS
ncbi:MAG: MATE family efflux transporter [Oscillospiraceae bacterium]|nr:MATE family efflux transporter [Oscillospiraceae bacterium]